MSRKVGTCVREHRAKFRVPPNALLTLPEARRMEKFGSRGRI